MPGTLDGHEIQLLVDTGASINLISLKWWLSKGKPGRWKEATEEIYTVEGRVMDVQGAIETGVELGGRSVESRFIIADVGNEAILGATFLRQNALMVDIAGERLLWGSRVEEVCKVVSVRAAVVAGGTEVLLEGCILGDWTTGAEGLVEGTRGHKGEPEFLVGRGLVKPADDRAYVRVLNPGRNPVVIYRHMTLATLQPVMEVGETKAQDRQYCRTIGHGPGTELVDRLMEELVGGTPDDKRPQLEELLR